MIEYREIPNKHVELRTSASKGEGIFAATPFKTGDTLMVGVIEKTLSKNHSHASQVGKDKFVFHAGLISKFNHSCNPNCGIAVNKSGAHDFIAMKDIKAGEEATFDYAMRNYGVDYFPMECKCGEKECRGQITGWKDLSIKHKSDYAGYVAPYLLEIDAELLREEREKTKTVAVNSSEAAV